MGVPERFVANYKASQRFLERLEALSSTTRALEAFRGSVAYQSWLDRWKAVCVLWLVLSGIQAIAHPVKADQHLC